MKLNGKAHNATWILLAGEVNKVCSHFNCNFKKKLEKIFILSNFNNVKFNQF